MPITSYTYGCMLLSLCAAAVGFPLQTQTDSTALPATLSTGTLSESGSENTTWDFSAPNGTASETHQTDSKTAFDEDVMTSAASPEDIITSVHEQREKRATSTTANPRTSHHIFEPCGAPYEVPEYIPSDELPDVVLNIKELSDTVSDLRDQIASQRISDLSTTMMLTNIKGSQFFRVYTYANTVSELEESLSRPNDTMKSLLLNQLRYTVYVQHVLANEQVLDYGDSILSELRVLESQLMRSFTCSLTQFAGNEGVTIDDFIKTDVNKITYELPHSKMFATFEAFIIFHSLESNFLSFALQFLEQYMQM